ncbi:MAG: hypothetical protein RQ731_07920, partial [Anaerosomatales bacterium]|nr:hypothetical protein [Anaerosomatales bacterium]
TYSGGFVGYNTGTITACSVTSSSSSTYSSGYSGGFVGYHSAAGSIVRNCFAACTVGTTGTRLGFCANYVTGTLSGNFWDSDYNTTVSATETHATAVTTAQAKAGDVSPINGLSANAGAGYWYYQSGSYPQVFAFSSGAAGAEAHVTGVGSCSAAGNKVGRAGAAVAGTGVVSASGRLRLGGVASVTGSGSVGVFAVKRGRSPPVVLVASATVLAEGQKAGALSAHISGVGVVTAQGVRVSSAAGDVSGVGAVAAQWSGAVELPVFRDGYIDIHFPQSYVDMLKSTGYMGWLDEHPTVPFEVFGRRFGYGRIQLRFEAYFSGVLEEISVKMVEFDQEREGFSSDVIAAWSLPFEDWRYVRLKVVGVNAQVHRSVDGVNWVVALNSDQDPPFEYLKGWADQAGEWGALQQGWVLDTVSLDGVDANGTANVVGAGAAGASWRAVRYGSAGCVASGACSASGVRVVGHDIAASGSGACSASGVRVVGRGAAVSGAGACSASGVRVVGRGAAVSGAGACAGAGSKSTGRSSSITGAGSVSADGTPGVRYCESHVSGGGGVGAGYRKLSRAAAGVGATGSVSAVGRRLARSTAACQGSSSLTALGWRVTRVSASVTAVGGLTAVGVRLVRGEAAIVGVGEVVASRLVISRSAHITGRGRAWYRSAGSGRGGMIILDVIGRLRVRLRDTTGASFDDAFMLEALRGGLALVMPGIRTESYVDIGLLSRGTGEFTVVREGKLSRIYDVQYRAGNRWRSFSGLAWMPGVMDPETLRSIDTCVLREPLTRQRAVRAFIIAPLSQPQAVGDFIGTDDPMELDAIEAAAFVHALSAMAMGRSVYDRHTTTTADDVVQPYELTEMLRSMRGEFEERLARASRSLPARLR